MTCSRWVQKWVDGEWTLVPRETDAPRQDMLFLPDIAPYVAYATREPTNITSRSVERRYMRDNGLVRPDGLSQDRARDKAQAARDQSAQIRKILSDKLNQ